jgi:hypothetical protein
LQPGRNYLTLPAKAQILKVANQHELLQLWALVETDNTPEQRTIDVYVTGIRLPIEDWRYIDTAVFDNGDFVVHIGEIIEKKPLVN